MLFHSFKIEEKKEENEEKQQPILIPLDPAPSSSDFNFVLESNEGLSELLEINYENNINN